MFVLIVYGKNTNGKITEIAIIQLIMRNHMPYPMEINFRGYGMTLKKRCFYENLVDCYLRFINHCR